MTLGELKGLKLLPSYLHKHKDRNSNLMGALKPPQTFFFLQNIVPLLPPLIRKTFTKNALTIVSSFHQTMRVRQDSHRGADKCVCDLALCCASRFRGSRASS